MKKYAWLELLVFAVALITVCVMLSKNEEVRETFMKATQDVPYIMEEARIFVSNKFSVGI